MFVGLWLFFATRAMARAFKRFDRLKWLVAVAYSLVVVGVGGFSATALSSLDILELPSSREWPAVVWLQRQMHIHCSARAVGTHTAL
jgi:hypothetical protein